MIDLSTTEESLFARDNRRLYYMKEFNSAAAPYLSSFLEGLPLTVVTEAFNGVYGAFITILNEKRRRFLRYLKEAVPSPENLWDRSR